MYWTAGVLFGVGIVVMVGAVSSSEFLSWRVMSALLITGLLMTLTGSVIIDIERKAEKSMTTAAECQPEEVKR